MAIEPSTVEFEKPFELRETVASSQLGEDKQFKIPLGWYENILEYIWCDILNQRYMEISTEDDIFNKYGAGLKEAEFVVKELKKRCAMDISSETLVNLQTIKKQAKYLIYSYQNQFSRIVKLIADSEKAPIIFVPPQTGFVYPYIALAHRFKDDRSIYLFRAPDLEADNAFYTIEEIARKFVQQIEMLLPEGPFYLSGWSMGGAVAIEIALQLYWDGKGDKIKQLILFEPKDIKNVWERQKKSLEFFLNKIISNVSMHFPKLPFINRSFKTSFMRYLVGIKSKKYEADELIRFIRFVLPGEFETDSLKELSPDELFFLFRERLSKTAIMFDLLMPPEAIGLKGFQATKVYAKNARLLLRYKPTGKYPGRVTIICDNNWPYLDRWQKYVVDPINTIRFPVEPWLGIGSHNSLISESNIDKCIVQLKDILCGG